MVIDGNGDQPGYQSRINIMQRLVDAPIEYVHICSLFHGRWGTIQ